MLLLRLSPLHGSLLCLRLVPATVSLARLVDLAADRGRDLLPKLHHGRLERLPDLLLEPVPQRRARKVRQFGLLLPLLGRLLHPVPHRCPPCASLALARIVSRATQSGAWPG